MANHLCQRAKKIIMKQANTDKKQWRRLAMMVQELTAQGDKVIGL